MQILAFLNFAAAIQGIFLTYLLVHSRHKSTESMILGLLTLVMSVTLLGAVLGLSGYYKVFPHLIRIGDPLVLLKGPLVYLYVYVLIHQQMPKLYGLHAIPFVLYLASVVPFYILSGNEKIKFVDQIFLSNAVPVKVILIQLLRLTHISVYILIGYQIIKKYQQKIKENFSDIEKISLNKAARTLQLFFIGTLISMGVYVSGIFYSLNFVLTNNMIGLFISIIIYTLALSTWNKPEVRGIAPIMDDELKIPDTPVQGDAIGKVKVRNNYFLTDEQVNNYRRLLEKLLTEDRLFLDNELTLAMLAERIDLQPYLVSELINRYAGEPFFDFINRYRIEEVKRRLNDPSHSSFSILGIAFDCGFNSKSSFNTAFKKFTGLTPSEFRQKKAA